MKDKIIDIDAIKILIEKGLIISNETNKEVDILYKDTCYALKFYELEDKEWVSCIVKSWIDNDSKKPVILNNHGTIAKRNIFTELGIYYENPEKIEAKKQELINKIFE